MIRRLHISPPRGRGFWRDTRGAAAAEFVLCLTMLTIPLLNVINIGLYAYERMQVESAAEAAVQMAWHTCSASTQLPTKNCSGIAATMLTAAQSATSLSTNVTMATTTSAATSAIVEGYYCSNGSGALTQVGTLGTPSTVPGSVPSTCTSVITGSTVTPGDYIQATASAPYASLFSGLSLISLPTTITRTAWMRLDQ
jgi:Flp pilus assembly protein TadG